MSIETTETELVISIEFAIALYRLGFIDGALLASVLPIMIASEQCPEIFNDGEAIARVSQALRSLMLSG